MKYIIILLLSISTTFTYAQDKLNPVSWKFDVEQDGDEYVFTATAELKDGWAIYSQHTDPDGPVPLSFTYEEGTSLIEDTKEVTKPIVKMSELFELEVIKFKKKAVFQQRFSTANGAKGIKGKLRFMSCDELRCLPPTEVLFDVVI